MNPRLSKEWLRYLVSVGARHDDDGWRWSIDPSLRLGGFGPWRPEWAMSRLPGSACRMLAVLGMQPELMGWGTPAEEVEPYLPPGSRLVAYDDVGHFVHIEQPQRVADLVLEFLDGKGTPRPLAAAVRPRRPAGHRWRTDHGARAHGHRAQQPGRPRPAPPARRRRAAAAAAARAGRAVARGGARPPRRLAGPGVGARLHRPRRSTVPAGGGYFSEVLMADVDAALGHLGPGHAVRPRAGRLRRPAGRRSASRPRPGRGPRRRPGHRRRRAPSRRRRSCWAPASHPAPPPTRTPCSSSATTSGPPDYAATYARQAATLSGLDTALVVTAVVRPPWLAAVAAEPGVRTLSRATRACRVFLPA